MLLNRLLLLVALFLVVPHAVPDARATTVLQIGMQELANTSTWIVRADVLGSSVIDKRDFGEGIFTDVHLAIRDTWKGANVPAFYTLRLIGGTGADGNTLKVPGIPEFEAGEQVVLFLEATSLGHIPTGLGQGVWRVLTTPSGDEWVRQSTGSAHLMRRGADGLLGPADERLIGQALPLFDLISDMYLHLDPDPPSSQLEVLP